MYTFVTGGPRSGRSNYALRRASELGHPPWLYVATGLETDEAVRKRIERHRRDVEAIWRTAVMPARLEDLVQPGALDGYGAVVIDGIAGWVEQKLASQAEGEADRALLDEMALFADRLYRSPLPIVLVTTEMSLGMVPTDPVLQRLSRVVSSVNQILAKQAGVAVLMVSGVPFKTST